MPIDAANPLSMTGGMLEKTLPAEIFRNLYLDRATAQVLMSRQSEERNFWFDKGQIISASSNREAQLVGDLLRTFGLAEESVLFAAFERALAEPGRGLARALSATGAVSSFVADACVRTLAERILYDTFTWTNGSYTITRLEAPPDLPVRFDRPTGTLVLEGLRRLPARSAIPGPHVDSHTRAVLNPDLYLRYQAVIVTQEEADALARVDGRSTAGELGIDPKVLARLAGAGLVQLLAVGRSPDRRVEGEEHPALNLEILGAPPPTRQAEQMEAHASLVWNTYRRIDWATLYEVVGVSPTASVEEIARAIHEKARMFHPDHLFKVQLANAREALEVLFRKTSQADRTLLLPESRTRYDTSLASSGGGQAMDLPTSEPTPEVQQQVAKANFLRARSLFEQEDFFPAYEMVKQSVEYDPSRAEYWILLSRIQRKNPKWVRQGAETMRRAAEKMPDNAEVWFELSEACAAERNEPERVSSLKQVLRIDPVNRRAQATLKEIAALKPGH